MDENLIYQFYERVAKLVPGNDDWNAIDVWLEYVAAVNPKAGSKTVQAYRIQLAKVRWYCEHELKKLPSEWTSEDVNAFEQFLAELPTSALCPQGDSNARKTPFRVQPSPNSLAQIMQFTKAMFKALSATGFLRNPSYGVRPVGRRRVTQDRTLPTELFELVLDVIDRAPAWRPNQMRAKLRDRFIFLCFRECGIRMSEILAAKMSDIHDARLGTDNESCWSLTVRAENSLNKKTRIIALSPDLRDAFFAYRQAFGLTMHPAENGAQYGLVLSIRTTLDPALGGNRVEGSTSLPPHLMWLSVATKQGLTSILNGRLSATAKALRDAGDSDSAALVERASSYWLRHTFAMDQLARGRNPRAVAETLGYAEPGTVAQYIDPKSNPYVIYESDLHDPPRQSAVKVIDPWDVV